MAELDPEDFPEESLGHEFKRNLALIIGIDAYKNGYPELKTAVNDAQAVANLLAQQPHNYKVTTLLNAQATTTDLKKILNKNEPGSWASQIGAQDRVLVYFAGHGLAEHSEKGPVGLMLLYDADLSTKGRGRLEMVQLQKWLNDLPCRHMLVVLDCCFAGAMAWSGQGMRGLPPEVIHKERYDHYVEYPAWQLITSAGDDERALDQIPPEEIPEVLQHIRKQTDDNHSPFAKALIEGLRDGAGDIYPPGQPGQPTGDGLITASELILHLANQVSDIAEGANHKQVPKLWPLPKHSSGEFVFLNPNREMQLNPAPTLDKGNNPYRTNALTEADAELFYGRDEDVTKLMEAVLKEPLALVTGASGVGKSSLVRAGLLPRFMGYKPPKRPGEIESDELSADPDQWQILPTFIPADKPTETLLNLLQTKLSDDASTDSPPDLPTLLAGWAKANPQCKLLLVVDQLERGLPQPTAPEPITPPEVEVFFDQLRTLNDFEQCHLVLVIREDHKAELEKLLEVKNERTFEVAPLDSESDLQKALERPAWARVLYYDPPELVTDVVQQLNRGPGALPLLARFGSRMYLEFIERGSQSRAITETDYQEAGSVADFICDRATDIYNSLKQDEDKQATMRRVVLRLMDIEGGELNRRRIPRSELDYSDKDENERVTEILRQLTEARLLVWSAVEGQPHLELAHDALVQDWELAKTWRKAENDEKILLQRRVTKDANDWADSENGEGLSLSLSGRLRRLWERVIADPDEGSVKHLWHDSPYLSQTEQMLEGENWQRGLWRYFFGHVLQPARRFWLNALELEFVQRSVNRQRRERFLTAYVIAFAIAVLSIITVYAVDRQFEAIKQQGIAEKNEATAVAERNIALSRQLAAQSRNELNQSNYDLALLLAIEAGRVKDTSEAFNALREILDQPGRTRLILDGHDSDVNQAIWNKNENQVLTVAEDKTVRVWDAKTGTELHRFEHNHQVSQASWSHNEALILTWGDKFIYLWDSATGTSVRKLIGHTSSINHVGWGKNGDLILSASEDGTARVWDVKTGEEMLKLRHGISGISYAAWNKDENQILTVGCEDVKCTSSSVLLWDAKTGQLQLELTGHTAKIVKAEWNASGTLISTYDNHGSVRVWDVRTGKDIIWPRNGFEGDRYTVQTEWNRKGTLLLVAITNRTRSKGEVYVWDIEQDKELLSLPHEKPVEWWITATWNASETEIMTINGDTIYIWNAKTGEKKHTIQHDSSVKLAEWNDDGTQIATVSREVDGNTINVWDVATEKIATSMIGHRFNIEQVAWNADQNLILSASEDDTARIWNLKHTLEGITLYHPRVDYAAWNEDENLILSYGDNQLRLWDAKSGEKKDEWPYIGNSYGYWDWFVSDNSIVTKNEDREVYLQSVVSKSEALKLPAVPWSSDKNRTFIATVAGPGGTPGGGATVLLIEASTGKTLKRWPARYPKWVSLNADGSLISIREGEDGFGETQWLHIYDTSSNNEEKAKIEFDDTKIEDVAWNNKGDRTNMDSCGAGGQNETQRPTRWLALAALRTRYVAAA